MLFSCLFLFHFSSCLSVVSFFFSFLHAYQLFDSFLLFFMARQQGFHFRNFTRYKLYMCFIFGTLRALSFGHLYSNIAFKKPFSTKLVRVMGWRTFAESVTKPTACLPAGASLYSEGRTLLCPHLIVYTHTYKHKHTHIHTHCIKALILLGSIHAQVVNMRNPTYIRVAYIHTYTHTYKTHIRMHIHTHMQTYTHTTHTYIHTYAHLQGPRCTELRLSHIRVQHRDKWLDSTHLCDSELVLLVGCKIPQGACGACLHHGIACRKAHVRGESM
jgi:hypothetical protein